jgi:hypothetical protein
MHEIVVSGLEAPISPCLMEVGDIAVVIESGHENFNKFLGHTILCSYSGLVSLTSPNSTWNAPSNDWPDFKVRILKPGTKITITVGE